MARPSFSITLDQFLDRPGVAKRLTDKERRVLGKTGSFGRRAMQQSIRKAPKNRDKFIRRELVGIPGGTGIWVDGKGRARWPNGKVVSKRDRDRLGITESSKRRTRVRKLRRGEPPRYHTRGPISLRGGILFGVNFSATQKDVVIGPRRFNARGGGGRFSVRFTIDKATIPQLLNEGGTMVQRGRGRGRFATTFSSPKTLRYQKHPFATNESPAMKSAVNKLRELMKKERL